MAETVGADEEWLMAYSSHGGGSVPRTRLPVHGTTRYIRTHLEVTDGVLRWEVPRTALGIVSLGTRMIEVAVAAVDTVRMRRFVPHPVRLLAGAAGVIAPWFFLEWWASVPLLILGLWVILVALGPHLEVVTVVGKRHRTPVCFRHQIDAELYIAAVTDLVEETLTAAAQ